MRSMATDATTATFEQAVIERSKERPVVVDFWAAWCGPCRTLGPILEAATADRADAVDFVKVDVDAEPELAQRWRIQGIPAVKAFRGGEVVAEFTGARPRPAIDSWLDQLTEPSELDRMRSELAELGRWTDILAALDLGYHEQALAAALEQLAASTGPDERDELRRLMVAIFAELGVRHPISERYRQKLATTIY